MTAYEFAHVTNWVPLVAVLGLIFGTRDLTKKICGGLLAVWVAALVAVIAVGPR